MQTSINHSNSKGKNNSGNEKPLWYFGHENGSVFPVFKLALQIILLALGMGAAIRFFYQLFDLVPK